MAFIFFNGKFLEDSTPIINADNRGLKYGDGIFETIKYKNGRLILFNEHLKRMWKGMELLQFEIPKFFTPDYIEHQAVQLIKKNHLSAARVKITVIRGSGGLYDPENHQPILFIQTWPLLLNNGTLNENGLELLLYKNAIKPIDAFSNLKHNNFLPYVMGALEAKKNKMNDAIIFNSHGNICDTTIANVFMIKNNTIITPPLSEGCIGGIMRDFILTELNNTNFTIIEQPISESMLIDADEVFLSNSIFNIKWVKGIQNKSYNKLATLEIFSHLLKTNPEVFC